MADLAVNKVPPALSVPSPPTEGELAEIVDNAERVLGHRYLPFPAVTLPEDWTVEKVRVARRQHDEGNFSDTMRLVRVVTTDPRVYAALLQRMMITLPMKVDASRARGGRGVSEVARAQCEADMSPKSYACPLGVRRNLRKDMILAGFAIAQVIWEPTADRWNYRIERWPLEHARWNSSISRYQLTTTEGLLTIEHGKGKWIILEPFDSQSWLLGAIRAISMPWADRTYAKSYRSQHAAAHGSPVPIAEMPEKVAVQTPEGKLLQRFIQMLLRSRIAGVLPFGSKVRYLEPTSNAWQVFDSIVKNNDEDIALAILGQDGTAKKGTFYTSPMFEGMRLDLTELDHVTFETAVQTGAINIWAAINYGAEFTPSIAHVIPDPDDDARIQAYAARMNGFNQAVKEAVDAGFEPDDTWLEELAVKYELGLTKLPTWEKPEPPAPALPPPAPANEAPAEPPPDPPKEEPAAA